MRQILNLPLTLGRKDSVEPKFAPLGVVSVAKNLRVRKDGRLACRNGYQALPTTIKDGFDIKAFDLHEINGRLMALGSILDPFPTDIYQLCTTTTPNVWLSSAEFPTSQNQINPITNMIDVAGVPQATGGVDALDVAAGLGFVAVLHRPVGNGNLFFTVTHNATQQTIFTSPVQSGSIIDAKIAFAASKFWILAVKSDNSIVLLTFDPVAGTAFTAAVIVDALSANAVTAFEISAISSPGAGVVIVGFDRGTLSSVTIKRYTSAVAQDGATLSIAGTDTRWLDLVADGASVGIVAVLIVDGAGAGAITLRTFNFAGAAIVGATAIGNGRRAQACLLTAGTDVFAVAFNTETSSVTMQVRDRTTLANSGGATIQNAQMSTRLLSADCSCDPNAVVLGGWTEPILMGAGVPFDLTSKPTNALWYLTPGIAHQATRDLGESSRFLATRRMGLCRDDSTGVCYWNSTYSFESSDVDQPSTTAFDLHSAKRRQSCAYGGMLYFSGSAPSVFDGRVMAEIGFNEIPGITFASAVVGAGALALLGTYTYVQHWEATLSDGSLYQSPPSEPVTVTLTGANNTIILTCTTPHCVRVAQGGAISILGVTAVLSRTVWNAASGTSGSLLRRCVEKSVPVGIANYGANHVITDTISDALLAPKAAVYTQGDRGSESGPVEHNAPEACTYVSASSARVMAAGLARAHEYQESKEAFLGEPVNFSRLSNFFGRSAYPINGVVSLDGVRILFTRDRLYAVSGEGPNDIGGGKLPPPVEIPSPGGLLDWRSLLLAPDGVYFQIDSTKLYRLPRGGGSPEWIGVDIQDTIRAFPFITGACRVRQDDCLAFACQNAELLGTDGRVAIRSLRTGLWTEDAPPLSGGRGIEAIASFGDTMAYVSGGAVFVQNTTGFADNTSTVIPTQLKTHPIYPFGLGGYGQTLDVLLTSEYRSAGTLALRVSFDDGVSFVTYDSFTLSGLTVGQTVHRKWSLQQVDTGSVVFEWTFTPSAPGEGLIMLNAALLVQAENGKLRELDPSECA